MIVPKNFKKFNNEFKDSKNEKYKNKKEMKKAYLIYN
jgi:hypothetical protein